MVNELRDKKKAEMEELDAYLLSKVGSFIDEHYFAQDELTLMVPAQHLLPLLTFLKNDSRCKFTQLMDICGVDFPDRIARFEVVYHLLSMSFNRRVRLKVAVSETVSLPTATKLYATAGWFEREVFDMFGILFDDHPDLRRILTDYGFEGFPLRKDFPLTGYVELRYDGEQKRVAYEPVQLKQDFRNFDFLSPWEGMTDRIQQDYLLPGDEKAYAQNQ